MSEDPSSLTNLPKSRFPWTAGMIAVALVTGIGGTWFVLRHCDGEGGSTQMAGCSMGSAAACGTGQSAPSQGKILFYRNPMNPSITSSVPKKDEMGMDYAPVYAK